MEPQWRKSSFSEQSGGDCIELAAHEDGVLLRESDDSGVIALIPAARLGALLSRIKSGHMPFCPSDTKR
ncbi:DUF397 domain-containing protein [Streptomyces boncukensis]|uniref:DUF397 domain-containing protein n=1 Tax=Streptomyces boncukensis TaxID=2711219 RepID=A0A6G4X1V7_9ACTN|nr:DUF397 domain-containing protein [Streptomyces boncukensis]